MPLLTTLKAYPRYRSTNEVLPADCCPTTKTNAESKFMLYLPESFQASAMARMALPASMDFPLLALFRACKSLVASGRGGSKVGSSPSVGSLEEPLVASAGSALINSVGSPLVGAVGSGLGVPPEHAHGLSSPKKAATRLIAVRG